MGALVVALVVAELPLVLSTCCAPAGATGLGTVWFVNDFAQYESALRQGAEQPGWLMYDVFTAEPHQPALMFPLYVAVGKLATLLHVAPLALERVLELLSRAALVLALWRFAHRFASGTAAARAAFLLALFGSGFELLALPFGAYTGNWSYELNTLGMLFSAPHVPLAMACTLELAAWLRPRPARLSGVAYAFGLGAAIALLHPFHLPVLLVAMFVVALTMPRTHLLGVLAALAGALPVLIPTVSTFTTDPFWSATYTVQNVLPSPQPHELIVDLGATLILAAGGAYALRSRVAPFGLVVWLLLMIAAMYVPMPYQRRLAFGLQPALALLAGNALVAACAALDGRRAASLRLAVAAAAASGTLLVVAGAVSSSISNWPLPVYRSTTDLDAAAAFLAARARTTDVVVADWDVANYLAPRSPARVFGGHPVATLDAKQKQFAVASLLAHQAGPEVARQFGATWLVYGPRQAGLRAPTTPTFQSGSVRIFQVAAAP